MPSFLLDTNAVSAAMADHPAVTAKMATCPVPIITCVIVQGEITYGLERLPAGKRRTNLETKAKQVLAAVPIDPVAPLVGEIYGVIRRKTELQGHNLNDNDLWIASTAMSLGATLVTNDQALNHVPGLTVEDWTK